MSGVFFGRGFLLVGVICLLVPFFCLRRHWLWILAAFFSLVLSFWKIGYVDERALTLEKALTQAEGVHELEGFLIVGAHVWPGSAVEDRLAEFRINGGKNWKVVVSSLDADWKMGMCYEVVGELYLPALPRNPGEISKRELWRARGAVAGFQARKYEPMEKVWWMEWQRWAEEARAAVRTGIQLGLDENSQGAQVIKAMVLGEKPPADSQLIEEFRLSGGLHVFAVSGLHVTLVGSLIWGVLGFLGLSRPQASVLVILGMFAYAILTGARPPAMRASIMGAVFISAFVFRRRPHMLNAWSFCLGIAILWRPEQLYDLGFQLSYGVLLSIGLGAAFFAGWTSKIEGLDPFLPRSLLNFRQEKWLSFRRWTSGMLAVSLAAWIGSLPLIAWHFGLITPVSIIAALVVIPMTFMVLALGLFSFFVGCVFPWGGVILNQVNEKVAYGSYKASAIFAALPGAYFRLPSAEPGEIIVYDMGGGGATWLQAGGGVLLDAGNTRDFSWAISSGLRQWRVAPDSLVLSHPDAAHIGGMALALEKYGCRQALIPVEASRSSSYQNFLKEARKTDCELIIGRKKTIFELEEGVSLEVLWAGKSGSGWLADDQGMVLRLHWQGWKILFMGDAGLRTTQEMQAADLDLRADIVVMGRHRGGGSGELGFLQATGAQAVVTSDAFRPSHEKVPIGWRESLEKAGIQVFLQSETGAVIFDLSEEKLILKSFLQPEKMLTLERP